MQGTLKASDLQELYQEVILDHNKNPRNYRKLENYTHKKLGHNPVCGDQFEVYLSLAEGGEVIDQISFTGEGCAISKASASLMTQVLKGQRLAEADRLFSQFHQLILRQLDPDSPDHQLGKLKIFAGIWKYPARVKCAGLAWHTLKAMVDQISGEKTQKVVTTE